MELKDTVELMNSEHFGDRLKAEYWQTKIRYEKLKDTCNRYEASQYAPPNTSFLKHEPKCSLGLLREQQNFMGHYLHILEIRAILYGIDLN